MTMNSPTPRAFGALTIAPGISLASANATAQPALRALWRRPPRNLAGRQDDRLQLPRRSLARLLDRRRRDADHRACGLRHDSRVVAGRDADRVCVGSVRELRCLRHAGDRRGGDAADVSLG